MPHKHKRREKDASVFELPPTQIAKPLPVRSTWQGVGSKPGNKAPRKSSGNKRKRTDAGQDDAPRAFKRLMAFAEGKPLRSGLDDGTRPKKAKKQKQAQSNDTAETVAETKSEPAASEKPAVPTINPGESMSAFSARVDAALPLSGSLVKKNVKNGKDVLGLKVWRTKKELKMHKLYDEWREEDRKIKEKLEEDAEEAEEKAMDDEVANGGSWRLAEKQQGEGEGATKGKKKKGKKGRLLGESNEREDDPWAVLKKKRAEAKPGLHDVVQAPPELEKFTGKKTAGKPGPVTSVANIPKAAGSLRRREQLEEARQDVLMSYRKLMLDRRTAGSSE